MKTNPPGVEFVINLFKFNKLNKRESRRRFFYVVDVQCQQKNTPKRVLHLEKLLI